MKDLLKEMSETQKMCCIYKNANDMNHFLFGKVLAVNDEEIAIHMISPDGDDDGVNVFSIDEIFRIEVDGEYSKKMEFLLSSNLASYNITIENNDIMASYLSYAQANRLILSIELLDSGYDDITGFIEMIKDGMCVIKQVDEYGYDDGISYILLNDITKISFLSEDEKRIMRLWEKKQK